MKSLDMDVELVDGEYVIDAPWLKTSVKAATFEEAYWLALGLPPMLVVPVPRNGS